jgi:uncharacterized protein YnzC (UPF0291/DUF896 family)
VLPTRQEAVVCPVSSASISSKLKTLREPTNSNQDLTGECEGAEDIDARYRLRQEQVDAGKGTLLGQLRGCLMADPDAPAYAQLAAQAGQSEAALRMAVYRLRQRYRELLREELAKTVANTAQIDEEFQHLRGALGA